MFGRGDRTVTASADAAGEQTPAITSQKSKSNRKFAEGGSPHAMVKPQAADPAQQAAPPSPTARLSAARLDPRRGEARPAKPGRCAP
jgi:hypothetical protein